MSLSLLDPVPKSTLRARIAERLRGAILAGDIPPGAPLVETALSERFDVSRGPLREALRQLIEEGLVVTVPYTGTHVAALSVDDVHEIYSLRTAIEIFAIEQLWERRERHGQHTAAGGQDCEQRTAIDGHDFPPFFEAGSSVLRNRSVVSAPRRMRSAISARIVARSAPNTAAM